jgi:hypothetical protein
MQREIARTMPTLGLVAPQLTPQTPHHPDVKPHTKHCSVWYAQERRRQQIQTRRVRGLDRPNGNSDGYY